MLLLISYAKAWLLGMFMYARLILKSLDYLDTIEEIRTELKVLPVDLNEA